jgi:hypothetical protein
MAALAKKVELLANVAIILVALLLGVVLVKQYLLQDARTAPPANQVPRGTKITLSGVDWSGSDQTLLLVLSEDCRFCTESAEFYRRLAQEKARRGGPRMIALLPQETDKGRAYLKRLDVAVDDVRQVPLHVLGVRGTPTLIVVASTGVVTESWVGKLSAEEENEVLSQFRPERASD